MDHDCLQILHTHLQMKNLYYFLPFDFRILFIIGLIKTNRLNKLLSCFSFSSFFLRYYNVSVTRLEAIASPISPQRGLLFTGMSPLPFASVLLHKATRCPHTGRKSRLTSLCMENIDPVSAGVLKSHTPHCFPDRELQAAGVHKADFSYRYVSISIPCLKNFLSLCT